MTATIPSIITTALSSVSTSMAPPTLSPNLTQSLDATSIDTFLSSLPLSSLQLLNYCCKNQTHIGIPTSVTSLETTTDSTSPCQWTSNPALLCDRFYANSFANLTNSAIQFLDSGAESSGDNSLWSAGSRFTAGTLIYEEDDSYLSPNLRILLTIILSLMIISTVIGNILVCLSVILVRKLRHPSNYLLVSLAISDLCVAILVMPLALQYELNQSWNLSHALCDLWVSFDVTCCTSSILNLCTISIDRYLAITKPLTYGVRRTTKRILSFIAAVWIASCLISIPPVLMLGNEHGTLDAPTCEVSQNIGYQLYATLGAFYIPLSVMIFMYYKIYIAAKRVVEAEMRDQRPSCSSATSQCVSLLKSCSNSTTPVPADPVQNLAQTTTLYPQLQYHHDSGSPNYSAKLYPESTEADSSNHVNCVHKSSKKSSKCKSKAKRKDSEQRKVQRMINVIKRDRKESTASKTSKSKSICSCCCSCLGSSSSSKSSCSSLPVTDQPNSLSVPARNGKSCSLHSKEPILTRHHGGQNLMNSHSMHIQHHRVKKSLSSERSSLSNVNYKRRASNALRERKASFTLGIIMSAFTVCWLPFFILALLRPFSSSIVEVPRFVTSIALWLGYANSMLNPIIYVTFHQDFRRAFKYLLCLQCSTMGSRLRAEAYISQYGGSLHHLNNSNGANNGTTNGKGHQAKNSQTLRANASWSQLDDKVVHPGRLAAKNCQFQQSTLQSSSTVPLLSQSASGEGPREYELQSITTNGTLNPVVAVSPGGGGIPVSLLLTTTFALTNTTTTTSARIAPIETAELPNDLQSEPVTNDYIDHPHSIDTESLNGYNISIQIDPTNHEATITRNTLL